MNYLVEVHTNGKYQKDIKYTSKKAAVKFLDTMIELFRDIIEVNCDQYGDPQKIEIKETSSSYTIVKAPLYITTPKFYFFVVKAEVNHNELQGCKIHQSMEAMYSYAAKKQGVDYDQVEACEFTITKDNVVFDDRGMSNYEVLESVEDYLKTFEL